MGGGGSKASVVMVGLDAAGKTTLLYKLVSGSSERESPEIVTTVPCIGFNVEQVEVHGLDFTVWDVGGSDRLKPLWRQYYEGTDAYIFMIDANDLDRLEEACDRLWELLSDKQASGRPLLVIANKQDLPNALGIVAVTEALGLQSLRDRPWYVASGSALHLDGNILDGLQWLRGRGSGAKREPRDYRAWAADPARTPSVAAAWACGQSDRHDTLDAADAEKALRPILATLGRQAEKMGGGYQAPPWLDDPCPTRFPFDGCTALQLCARHHHVELASLLLAAVRAPPRRLLAAFVCRRLCGHSSLCTGEPCLIVAARLSALREVVRCPTESRHDGDAWSQRARADCVGSSTGKTALWLVLEGGGDGAQPSANKEEWCTLLLRAGADASVSCARPWHPPPSAEEGEPSVVAEPSAAAAAAGRTYAQGGGVGGGGGGGGGGVPLLFHAICHRAPARVVEALLAAVRATAVFLGGSKRRWAGLS
jgi:ADP-ribosylation factor protein 1